jgi:hypothetical protein
MHALARQLCYVSGDWSLPVGRSVAFMTDSVYARSTRTEPADACARETYVPARLTSTSAPIGVVHPDGSVEIKERSVESLYTRPGP